MSQTTAPRPSPPTADTQPTRAIFNDFDILTEPYVVREGHPIAAHILLPKTSSPGPRPLIINWHGGYLLTGHGLFPAFFPQFLLNLAKKHSAIIISPDYTLLPHKDGLTAVQEDIHHFQKWLNSSFSTLLSEKAPTYQADLSRVLLNGGSAGGYVASSHALAFPTFFRGLSLTYPMINFDTEWWRKGSRATGAPNPANLPDSIFPTDDAALKERIEGYRNGPRVSSADSEREGFGMSIARAGFFHGVFSPDGKLDDDATVWPNRRVEQGAQLPERIWVLHGDSDTLVPLETSVSFAETMKAQGRAVRLDIVAGVDHGFDLDPVLLTGPQILSGTEWLAEKWLE